MKTAAEVTLAIALITTVTTARAVWVGVGAGVRRISPPRSALGLPELNRFSDAMEKS